MFKKKTRILTFVEKSQSVQICDCKAYVAVMIMGLNDRQAPKIYIANNTLCCQSQNYRFFSLTKNELSIELNYDLKFCSLSKYVVLI